MFKKIVLAVDGSEHSRAAVPIALELARTSHAEALVFHVHDIAGDEGVGWCQELVDHIADNLRRGGVAARGEVSLVVPAAPAKEILKVANREQADLIVMGSRGRSDLAGLLLGSVSHKVLQLAQVPVLIVPLAREAETLPVEPKHTASVGGPAPL